MDAWKQMAEHLAELEAAELIRRPVELESPVGAVVSVDGREVVCLCGNDYLSLANDPAVKRAAREAIRRWGVGSGASRLVCGTQTPHRRLERRLARFKQAEDAVVTSTGWMANHAVVHALVGPGDLLLADKLDHASIIDAALACGARLRTIRTGTRRAWNNCSGGIAAGTDDV